MTCKGKNCNSNGKTPHSSECRFEYAANVASGVKGFAMPSHTTDHIATLEELRTYYMRYSDEKEPQIQALDAAIALMRGQSDMVLVPRTLTAENGAKGALIGEFTTPFVMQCLECTDGFVDDEVCDDCDGAGSFTVRVPVEWTTINDIHKAMIAHFHPAPKDTADEQ